MPNPNLPINTKMNTYIGARYVPKFANKDLNYQWINTRSYEPLMIVLYQGNSYTSTTFVPVGIDINNLTYWAPTGSYNSQVEQYRQEVLNLQNTVDLITLQLNNLSQVSAITIGDSYATEYEKDGQTITPWSVLITQYLPQINWLGNFSASGAGFGAGTGSDPYTSFVTLAQRAVQGVSDANKSKVKLIICNGGSNDIRYERQLIRNGIDSFTNILKNNFPNAKILFFFTNLIATGTGSLVTLLGTVYPYYTQIMGYNGITIYQDLWKTIHSGYFMASDLSHPNITGQENLARGIASAIQGNLMLTRIGEQHIFDGDLTGKSWLESDGIHLEIWSSQINTNNITLNNQWIKIGSCSEAYIFNTLAKNFVKINASYLVNGVYKNIVLQLYISKTVTGVTEGGVGIFENDIYVKLDNNIVESGGSLSITNVEKISVFEQHFVLPFYP